MSKRPGDASEGTSKKGKSDADSTTHDVPGTADNNQEGQMDTGPIPEAPIITDDGFDTTGQLERAGAVGGTDSGGTGYINQLPRCLGFSATQYFRYKKSFMFYTHAFSREEVGLLTGNNTRYYMTTGMAAIPTDLPFMYCSESEWQQLSGFDEAYIESGTLSLFLHNCRTSYQANATSTVAVPVGNQIYYNVAHGLESVGNNIIVTNHPVSATPAKVASIQLGTQQDLEKLATKMYGNAEVGKKSYLPSVCGNWQEWDLYWALGLQHFEGAVIGGSTGQLPNKGSGYGYVNAQFREILAVPNMNTHIKTVKTSFGHRLLTLQQPVSIPAYLPVTFGANGYNLYLGAGLWDGQGVGTLSANSNTYQARPSNLNNGLKITATPVAITLSESYYRSMWDPRRRGNEPGKERMKESPPKWLALGMAPVIGITATTDDVSYQEGQCFWTVQTELVVSIHPRNVRTRGMLHYKNYTDKYYTYSNEEMLPTAVRMGGHFLYGRPFTYNKV